VEFELIATQSGPIQFDAKEGDILAQGAALAHVDDTKQQLEMVIAEASLSEATAQFEQAGEKHLNDTSLFEKGSISQKALDKSAMDKLSAQARLSKQEASFALKKRDYNQTKFVSPVSAIFVEKHVKDFNHVNQGEKIARLMKIDVVEVEIYPPFSQYSSMKVGDEVDVSGDGQPSSKGKVVFISPQVDPTTKTFRVKIHLNNIANPNSAQVLDRYRFTSGTLVTVSTEISATP